MSARRGVPPRAVLVVDDIAVEDETTQRALDVQRDAITKLQTRNAVQIIEVDLAIGINAVRHSLGRVPVAVNVTPTVADAAFAWCLDKDNSIADRQVLIEVIGRAQPNATVRVE